MTPRKLLLTLAAASFLACVKQVPPAPTRSSPQAVPLLKETAEQETEQFTALREDVEIDTRDFSRTPHVVATGETPLLRLEGARARLAGNAAGTRGFSVDNFILFEVLDEKDKVVNRAAVGFTDSVLIGKEQVDNVGRMSFTFEPDEVDLTALLPESASFKLRATVLDYSGLGRVSDVFLRLEPRGLSHEDDLRGH
ncbi:hypothetical protein [Stigmatella aurantiaca]|uniref:Conserved uncharacterized protein n=1 Tax=Stigmatella aurantiaca (strain DW4/3-1) TaxID=378806 RepID=Q098P1_STIAD|nr:hypothetical protein [Stigmatella aurantiaca]ADO74149.1 conserved uncharacterized protein [Stigmatella aurantiaca DW4/3-1]EAU68175.1 hypothetical protein STIAU_7754 [Stigmatella aurantiaca DW4/3-1]